jgi:hypothetical protein
MTSRILIQINKMAAQQTNGAAALVNAKTLSFLNFPYRTIENGNCFAQIEFQE